MKCSKNSRADNKPAKNVSLGVKIIFYFMIFTAIIIALLWALMIFSLNSTYRTIRVRNITDTGTKVVQMIGEGATKSAFDDIMEENDCSAVLYNEKSNEYVMIRPHNVENVMTRFDTSKLIETILSSKQSREMMFYMNSQGMELAHFEILDAKYDRSFYDSNVKAVIYVNRAGDVNGNEYLLMVIGSIVPVEATISTLRYQLFWISIMLVIVAVVLATIVSMNIARPISETANYAKQLSIGNYTPNFDARGYQEIEELSSTLNAMAVELNKADQIQKDLIANISHDLRTPLTMISGYGELIRDIPNENTPENVQVIIDEANRLTSLVNNILDISKLQSGTDSINLGIINSNDLIEEAAVTYRKMMENKGYEIITETDEQVNYVLGDIVRIQQVLYNLINNALNHCGEDKQIIIKAHRQNDVVRFEVVDHGEGIAQQDLDKIWQRYYKANNHSRFVAGSGLGLSIVKTILDLHHANYGVESVVAEGSDFWFELNVSDN